MGLGTTTYESDNQGFWQFKVILSWFYVVQKKNANFSFNSKYYVLGYPIRHYHQAASLPLSFSLCDSAHHFSFWRQKSKFCLAFSLLEKAEEALAPGICSDSAIEFLYESPQWPQLESSLLTYYFYITLSTLDKQTRRPPATTAAMAISRSTHGGGGGR